MDKRNAIEVVTVQEAETRLGLTHETIISLIAQEKLKWTKDYRVELPLDRRRWRRLIAKSK